MNESPEVFKLATKGKKVWYCQPNQFLMFFDKWMVVDDVDKDGYVKYKKYGPLINLDHRYHIERGIYDAQCRNETSTSRWIVEGSDEFNRLIIGAFNNLAPHIGKIIKSKKVKVKKDGTFEEKSSA